MAWFTRAVVNTRWGRFALAVLLLALAAFIGYVGYVQSDIKMKTGALSDGQEIYTSSNVYQSTELTLEGDPAKYLLNKKDFIPALDHQFVQNGTIDVWYTQIPNNQPRVVALQLRDENDANPTMYTTEGYRNPSGQRLIAWSVAGAVAVVGIAAMLAGLFLPAASRREQVVVAPSPDARARP